MGGASHCVYTNSLLSTHCEWEHVLVSWFKSWIPGIKSLFLSVSLNILFATEEKKDSVRWPNMEVQSAPLTHGMTWTKLDHTVASLKCGKWFLLHHQTVAKTHPQPPFLQNKRATEKNTKQWRIQNCYWSKYIYKKKFNSSTEV